MLHTLIIGGGIHGTHLAHCLLHHTPLTHDDVRILDPHQELLHEWWRCIRNCGMHYLRSPSVHHIDIHPFSLDKFALLPEHRQEKNFIAPKHRPSVKLFRKHCRMVIDTHRLESLLIRGKALAMKNQLDHVGVVTADGTIDARMVLLALGMNNQPLWPRWATELKERAAPIAHVFDPSFNLKANRHRGPIAVIGSGISGVQVALNLVEKGVESILLMSRKALHVSNFDFDPGWLGPKYLDDFSQQPLDEKRKRITAARIKGSIPKNMKSLLNEATRREQIAFIEDDITDASVQDGSLLLSGRHGQYACQQVILATGFREAPPGNGLMTQTIKEFHLKTAPCGFPEIAPSLRWHERIFVSGPLSELQIGPSARNIAGARHSGRRITAALNKELKS